MKHTIPFLVLCLATWSLLACSTDDDVDLTPIPAEAQGTFTDARDGNTYRYVRYGNLDWMAENCRHQLSDATLYSIYQDADTYYEATNNNPSTRNLAKYGCLYTLEGARQAAPAGWRLPTDAEWQALEQAMGMSAAESGAREWRGNVGQRFLAIDGRTPAINILLGGYYTQHVTMGTSGWRFKGVQAFFWTGTKDPDKSGEYYFYRRFRYNADGIYRQSMETAANKLSVRYVRNAS